jgi:osmotically inducible protein OsmC
MAAESRATTVWEGSLAKGRGTTSAASGALPELEVTWPARTERTEGTTSPEELLATAHAACYCMGLSHELDQAGNSPERLEATATISFVPGEGVKASHIVVTGRVAGVNADGFEAAAQAAGENCPISGALRGNVEITVEATLEGEARRA